MLNNWWKITISQSRFYWLIINKHWSWQSEKCLTESNILMKIPSYPFTSDTWGHLIESDLKLVIFDSSMSLKKLFFSVVACNIVNRLTALLTQHLVRSGTCDWSHEEQLSCSWSDHYQPNWSHLWHQQLVVSATPVHAQMVTCRKKRHINP